MRLGDLDALKKILEELAKDKFDSLYGDGIRRAIKEIDNAPTVAVNCKDCDGYEAGYSAGLKDAERPKGEWVEIGKIMKNGKSVAVRCNKCGKSPKYAVRSDFCPNCGADMQKGEEE